MSLRTKYAILKATTIVLGALSIPWSTYIGFCFGEGRYSTGVVALCLQTAVALIDGYIWFWVLENMRSRLEEETGKSEVSFESGTIRPQFATHRASAGRPPRAMDDNNLTPQETGN